MSTTPAACSGRRSTTSSTPPRDRLDPRRALTRTFKLVYFVPEEALDETREAIFAAGGGRIGDYERCSWFTPGTGTFLAREGADPAIGEVGREEHVPELRVELVVGEDRLPAALEALRASHPYEEVAFDLYPLHVL